ncbi:carbohydrate binding domain-containing protein [Marinimicrobium locisalis]|uniref:glucuronyl esterase domain-containing protein n=1 Tax=Marinimicrobium locisalis TaxID=546022 RepID=UPI003D2FD7A6
MKTIALYKPLSLLLLAAAPLVASGQQCTEMCEWYQDAPRPLCQNQDSGWGWENQQSCIGRTTCNGQTGDGGVVSVCDGSSSASTSSAASSITSSIASSAVSSTGNGANTLTVRMQGVTGEESVSLEIDGSVIETWTLGTAMMDYSANTSASGEVRVAFTNDSGDRDVQVDYLIVNGEVREAEDQQDNTGAWDDTCGGGSFSEMLHCDGSIGFGTVSGPVASSSASSVSSTASISSSASASSEDQADNLLSNGDVESGALSPWEGRGGSIELSQAQTRSGIYSVLAANRTANWHGIAMPLGSLNSGQEYSISAWVRLMSDEPATEVTLTVQRTDGSGDTYINLNSTQATSSGWVELSGTYTHSASGSVSTLIAYVESSNDTVAYYVDDMVMTTDGDTGPVDPPPPPPTDNNGENSGSHCNIPALPSYNQLTTINGLPDPFRTIDGTDITSADDWTCRRAEISAQLQRYELGEKPAPTATVSGSGNGSSITVNVQDNGGSISFSANISLPNGGQPPYPAVIGMGGSSLNNDRLRNQGVAVITFPNNDIASQAGGNARGQGKFYDLYGGNHSAGAMAAWAWGVSRLIDALETTPSVNIDADRLAVTGCSRNGKGALMAGALDERIRLAVPQESGSGGSAAWRVSDAQQANGQNVQTLSQIVTENVWFRESFSQFGNSATRLPFDHHEVLGLVAPRGLLVLENTDMEWLGNESTYTAAVVAREIWEALGVSDHMAVSQMGGYSHCQFPSSQQNVLDAFVARFLLDSNNGNTDVIRTDGNINVDFNRWVNWDTPALQ